MKWMEVTVFTTEQGLDAVCGRLDMLGINQVMIEQGRESIEQFLHDTAKYWDYADMDALVASEEPCVRLILQTWRIIVPPLRPLRSPLRSFGAWTLALTLAV